MGNIYMRLTIIPALYQVLQRVTARCQDPGLGSASGEEPVVSAESTCLESLD